MRSISRIVADAGHRERPCLPAFSNGIGSKLRAGFLGDRHASNAAAHPVRDSALRQWSAWGQSGCGQKSIRNSLIQTPWFWGFPTLLTAEPDSAPGLTRSNPIDEPKQMRSAPGAFLLNR